MVDGTMTRNPGQRVRMGWERKRDGCRREWDLGRKNKPPLITPKQSHVPVPGSKQQHGNRTVVGVTHGAGTRLISEQPKLIDLCTLAF